MSLLQIISLITTFQLLQLSVVLFVLRRGNIISNRILGTYMLVNALLLISYSFGLELKSDFRPDTFFYFLLAPYLFLYVKSLCLKDFKRNWLELGHWIPALLFLCSNLLLNIDHAIIQILLDIQIAIYLVLIFRVINSYNMEIRNHFSSLARIDVSWLLLIMVTFVVMFLSDVFSFVLIEMSIITDKWIYALAFFSISINLVFATSLVIIGLRHQNALSGLKDSPKYSGSTLEATKVNEYKGKLISAFEGQKLFLNPHLSLKDLAREVDVHPKYLSQVINSEFGMNFFDFVNLYRVNEAKRIMINEYEKTVLEILYEVGYNSKSAFNKAFKKNVGNTPTEFKKLQKKSSLS